MRIMKHTQHERRSAKILTNSRMTNTVIKTPASTGPSFKGMLTVLLTRPRVSVGRRGFDDAQPRLSWYYLRHFQIGCCENCPVLGFGSRLATAVPN
jgi:hypothetical protein